MSEKGPIIPHNYPKDHSARSSRFTTKQYILAFFAAAFLFTITIGTIANEALSGSSYRGGLGSDDYVFVPREHRAALIAQDSFGGSFFELDGEDYAGSETERQQEALGLAGSGKFGTGKVKLEAHIMSKCPDARDCLRDLILPTMEKVSDNVDFTLSYIGTVNDADSPDPVICKHGPTECLGNIIELCAADLYPDPKIYLGFTMCLSQSYQHIPERSLIQECALEHGIDFQKLNECGSKDDGAYGMDLLRQSVAKSEQKSVVFSCTVRLEDEFRCIRDGGKWKDCDGGSAPEDLIRDIEEIVSRKSEV